MLQLSEEYKRSIPWLRKQIKKVSLKSQEPLLSEGVVVADSTFFKRAFGFCVFRSPLHKKNLYWSEIQTETVAAYRAGREVVEAHGFRITAIVLDGRPGIREVFADIPIQMCLFHQKMILNRYLTQRPKLLPAQELRGLTMDLRDITRQTLISRLDTWYKKWKLFLKEKTRIPFSSRWQYTHRRIRAAYRSLKQNMPYLFTYQDYPDLGIPTTTNSLDGCFSHLKNLIGVHRGTKKALKIKIINQYLLN